LLQSYCIPPSETRDPWAWGAGVMSKLDGAHFRTGSETARLAPERASSIAEPWESPMRIITTIAYLAVLLLAASCTENESAERPSASSAKRAVKTSDTPQIVGSWVIDKAAQRETGGLRRSVPRELLVDPRDLPPRRPLRGHEPVRRPIRRSLGTRVRRRNDPHGPILGPLVGCTPSGHRREYARALHLRAHVHVQRPRPHGRDHPIPPIR